MSTRCAPPGVILGTVTSLRVFLLAALVIAPRATAGVASRIPLEGTWNLQLDPAGAGHAERWFERRFSGDTMFLPGSTDQAGYGAKTVTPDKGWLTRPYKYAGAAWYQKEITVPDSWRGRRITLFLERPHWQTELWVDGRPLGMRNSLSTPHEYELSSVLPPGPHRLTLCVDNSYKIDVGHDAHSVGEHTQTNWNGIVGTLELRASAPAWIDDIAIYTDVPARRLRVTGVIHALPGAPAAGDLRAAVPRLAGAAAVTKIDREGAFELTMPVNGARLWDEYDPSLYTLALDFSGDHREVTFGLRQMSTRGTQFLLNGRPIFLRGTLECNIFPLTGYPPTDVESWARLFRIARSYGLNAFRFHSYTPPEAAFTAADRAGFLLHVELPVWSNKVGKDPALNEFMRAEGYRILKAYGNHPSFTMLCLGNELVGDDKFMDDLVAEFKAADPRRLFTFSADHRRRAPGPTSDYYMTQQPSVGRLRINGTRFGRTEGGTDTDFAASVASVPMPLVAHELGQWAVYPSYDEIGSYTGVLKARNLEVFRDQLAARGMADQAADFQHASGRFSWSVYKEDMEAALRTPNFGGFFLLQLQDFPGQGEALIGLLDSFWNSKGILTPEEFRRFNSQTVPLARMRKFVWTSAETFTAQAEIAHYGREAIPNAAATWSLTDDGGRVLHHGDFPHANIALGSVTPLGEIRLPLTAFKTATHLKLAVALRGTEAANDWDLWFYPAALDTQPPPSVLVTTVLDAAARARLEQGGRVLLHTPKSTGLLPMRFLPIFWSKAWGGSSFTAQPAAMGTLCDPAHPALASFPTAMYSQWQWWELTESSHAFILNDTPAAFRPIVQWIDDFHRNHKLGAVFEARVGQGSLLVTSFDLSTNLDTRPVARQLLHSLQEYARGDRFHPSQAFSIDELDKLLR
jgi:Glycosyl hydrolases family 2, sugar binding domain/Glycosyl hydrolases family 2, TIM barrel domain